MLNPGWTDYEEDTIQRLVRKYELANPPIQQPGNPAAHDRQPLLLHFNNTVIDYNDLVCASDTTYQEFLLEVERFNDERFKNKKAGIKGSGAPQPTNYCNNIMGANVSHPPNYCSDNNITVGANFQYPPNDNQTKKVEANLLHPPNCNSNNKVVAYALHPPKYCSSKSNGSNALTAPYSAPAKSEPDYDMCENDDDCYDGDEDCSDENQDQNSYDLKEGEGRGDEGYDVDKEDVEDADDEGDDDCVDEHLDSTEELSVYEVTKVFGGYIINSAVFLTLPQWHTLMTDTDTVHQTYCAVCDVYIDVETDDDHVEQEDHLKNFELFKPLKMFELSITRLIRTSYHCGVCNQLFDDRDDNNHVDTKQHGENMLFAINKASDLLYDCADDPPAKSQLVTTAQQRHYRQLDRYSEETYGTPDDTDEYDDPYDQPIDAQNPGVSYAAMARKTKMEELPDLLKFDLGDKIVTVKFDSWHMIVSTGLNRLYCMACQVTDHKRMKAAHCRSTRHMAMLSKCTVVEVYDTHLIRKVDDKLYHCGHCNNLQPIDLMEEHVEQYHPRNIRTPAKPARNQDQNLERPSTSQPKDPAPVPKKESRPGANLLRLKAFGLPAYTNTPPQNKEANTVKEDTQSSNLQRLKAAAASTKLAETPPTNKDEAQTLSPQTPGTPKEEDNTANAKTEVSPNAAPTKTVTEYFKAFQEKLTLENPANGDTKVETPTPAIVEKSTGNAQSSNGNSVTSVESETKTTETKPAPSIQGTQLYIPATKLTPIVNFQPDYAKTIYQFGYKLSIHILSLNAIIKVQYYYRCMLCDLAVEEPLLLEHMLDVRHVALIPTAPYIPEFSLHLIRRIRMFVHCAICNVALPSDHLIVLSHNASPAHAALLRVALGYNPLSAGNQLITGTLVAGSRGLLAPLAMPPPIPMPPGHGATPVATNGTPPNAPFPPPLFTLPPPLTPADAPSSPNSQASNDAKTAKKKTKTTVVKEEVLVKYTEELYLVKKGKMLFKVGRNALNAVVCRGDGTKYCFVCEANIGAGDPMGHIEDLSHRKRLTESKMVSTYGSSLLRQTHNTYHCAACNVIIQKRYLQRHLDWYKHLKHVEDSLCSSEADKLDHNQAEIPRVNIPTVKERLSVKDKFKLLLHYAFVIDRNRKRDAHDTVWDDEGEPLPEAGRRLSKIIIVEKEVFKIKWDHWHGLVSFKDGFKCKICSSDVEEEMWREHVQDPTHLLNLAKPFVQDLPRDLLRQLTESTLHCLLCNVELSTCDNICEHLDGKRHNKNREQTVKESAQVNAYTDCELDVLFL